MEKFKHYTKRRMVGSGSYGRVYIVRDNSCKKGNHAKALKEYNNEKDLECISASTIREISILKELNEIGHANIIRLEQVLREKNKICTIYEWMRMDLKDLLEKNANPKKRIGLPLQNIKLFKGLDFLHSHGVMHRDLKPANILVEKNGILKIADFGMARYFSIPNRSLSRDVVTLWYRAPEIMLGKPVYDFLIDIWSAGCIIFEMALGKVLFEGDSEIDQLFQVFQFFGTPKFKDWPNLQEYKNYSPLFPKFPSQEFPFNEVIFHLEQVLQKTLEIQPRKRATAGEILKCDLLRRVVIAPVNRLIFN